MTIHLTRSYRMIRPVVTPGEGALRFPSVPVAACGAEDGEQVSIYPDGAGEDRIDCPDCTAWLNRDDNRLLILNVDLWISLHAASHDIHYIDIPLEEG